MIEQKELYHFVCDCGMVLINFGYQQECEIIPSGKKHAGNYIKNILKGNIHKMDMPEKEMFFREKYSLKQ